MKNLLRIFFLCALLPWVAHAQFVPGVGASGTSAGSVSGGGGGAGNPAGSSGDFQINSGGSFGAITPGTGVATAFANATNGTGGFVTFSGNIGAATGTSLTLNGGGAAGYVELTQGTAPSAGTTSIKLYAPASVTSYIRTFEGSAGSTGYYKGTVSGTTVTDSKSATIPIGDVSGGTNHNVATYGSSALGTGIAPGANGNVLTSNGTDWTSAAGGGGGWSTGLLTTTTGNITSSAAETTIFTCTVAGGTLGTAGAIRCVVEGLWVQNAGSNQSINFKIKYGGTTLWDSSTSTGTSSANPRPTNVTFLLVADGATNAQRVIGEQAWAGPPNATAVGYGNLSSGQLNSTSAYTGTSAVDSTASQDIVVTATISSATSTSYTAVRGIAYKL